MKSFLLTFSILLGACTTPTPWILDSIVSTASDSKRLAYRPLRNPMTATIEFYSSGSQTSSYFSSTGRRLANESSVLAKLSLGTETLEEELPLHEGRMRVRLPDNWTLKTIEALKEGREVAIVVGPLQETLQPERFSGFFEQLRE